MSADSIGMIEVGGASVQVVYELTNDVEKSVLANMRSNDAITAFRHQQSTVKVSENQNLKLFAATFLGLGVNSARQFSVDLLVRDHLRTIDASGAPISNDNLTNHTLKLDDPCLSENSNELMVRPIGVATDLRETMKFINGDENQTFKVQLEGSGNFLNCINLLERVIQLMKTTRLNCPSKKKPNPCPMSLLGERFIPYDHYRFVGLSEMFFTTNEMMNLSGTFNKSSIMHKSNEICSTKYHELIERYSKDSSITHPDRIFYECFKACWILTLMHSNGFSLPNDYRHFNTLERLDGKEIDWTIGALVTEIALNQS